MNLFIDIETHPDLSPGALQAFIDAVEPPGQYKKPESIAEWKAANAETIGRETWSRTALDPMSGGIYIIGYAVEDGPIQTLWRHPEEPEAPFLEAALSAIASLRDSQGNARPFRFIGWNHIGFDIPFIAKRCAILGIIPALKLPINVRFNNERVLDLMQTWAGYGGRQKQRDVATAMGIELLDELDGKDMWAAVERDGVQSAISKCKSDIDALRKIYNRMRPVFEI